MKKVHLLFYCHFGNAKKMWTYIYLLQRIKSKLGKITQVNFTSALYVFKNILCSTQKILVHLLLTILDLKYTLITEVPNYR